MLTFDDATRERVLVARPLLPSADALLPYLRRIDDARVYTNQGPLCSELEQRLASLLRLRRGGLACAASGTSALIGAILGCAGQASERRPLAMLPAYTYAATADAVERCGYVPYLVDVHPQTWALDPAALVHHPEIGRVGLVVPVAPFGRSTDLEQWQAFRDAEDIPVVVDGAASFDRFITGETRLGPVPVAISFHATKCFGVGEGGAVVSSDTDVVARAARALNFGFSGTRESRAPSINGKMSEYHAAVGHAELDGWCEKYAALRSLADRYRSALAAHDLSDRLVTTPEVSAAYVLFRCADESESVRLRTALGQRGIGHRLWYERGLHHQTAFRHAPRDGLPVTEALAGVLLGIPVAPDLSDNDLAAVVDALGAGVKSG